MKFTDFDFRADLARAIARNGFTEPSPIQEKSIPVILDGKDMVGQAHTGTGKTAAFTLPLLQKMTGKDGVEIVVIVPTRELATQVADEMYRFSRNMGNIRTATVYGGTSYKRQINHIENAGIVVATPGRFLDLLDRKKIDIGPKYIVLDEADEMLNMGFLEDIRRIFSHFEDREQTLMFSATMPNEIKELAKTILKDPEFIRVEKQAVTKNSIKQYFYVVDEHERDDAIVRLIDVYNPKKAIVFCRTKKETSRLGDYLNGQGYKAASLHGDIEQWDRQKIMKSFRKNEYEILVATDVAARGIDVRGVTHVFNYHIPLDPESYVHRIGRTGRAERKGSAMTLVTPYEISELKRIEKEMGSNMDLEVIPNTKGSGDVSKDILSLLKKTKESDISETLDEVLKKYNPEELISKLLSHTIAEMKSEELIGKTKKQAKLIIEQASTGGGPNTKNKRGGKRRSKKGPSNRGRRRNDNKIRRGTGRGEIPIPTMDKIGSSRIVPRKLY
jgi:ATP-dependent RNA helicase DeaD